MTNLSNSLKATIAYFSDFATQVDENATPPPTGASGQPCPTPKSGKPALPIILNRYSKPRIPEDQNYLWDVFIPDLEQRPTKSCTPKYIVYQCDCGRHILPSVCMSRDCVTCAPHVQKRTGQSIFARFGQRDQIKATGGSLLSVCYTVFTIPPHLRDKFLDQKELQKVRLKAWRLLKDKFGALFGVEATHPIGDKDLLFHPHLNFLWHCRKGFRPFIDVNLLRIEWAHILGVQSVDVYHKYAQNNAQLYHWCEYVGRPFPGYNWWRGCIRWYGKYPKVKRSKEILCADCGQPYIRIGTIEASLVSDYYARGWLIGLDPPWMINTNLTLCRGKERSHARPSEDNGAGTICSPRDRIHPQAGVEGD